MLGIVFHFADVCRQEGPLTGSNWISEENMLTFAVCSHSSLALPIMLIQPLYLWWVLMGLTQVIFQVKDGEMVCKQTELIPRLKQLSPAGAELHRYPPPFAFSRLPSSSFPSPPPTLLQPRPASQIVSDSVQQKLSRPSKRYPNTA